MRLATRPSLRTDQQLPRDPRRCAQGHSACPKIYRRSSRDNRKLARNTCELITGETRQADYQEHHFLDRRNYELHPDLSLPPVHPPSRSNAKPQPTSYRITPSSLDRIYLLHLFHSTYHPSYLDTPLGCRIGRLSWTYRSQMACGERRRKGALARQQGARRSTEAA